MIWPTLNEGWYGWKHSEHIQTNLSDSTALDMIGESWILERCKQVVLTREQNGIRCNTKLWNDYNQTMQRSRKLLSYSKQSVFANRYTRLKSVGAGARIYCKYVGHNLATNEIHIQEKKLYKQTKTLDLKLLY